MELETGQAEDKGGYAKALGEEFYRRQRELLTEVVRHSDVVITTAAVPGQEGADSDHARDGRRHAAGFGDRGPGGRARRQLRGHRARPDRVEWVRVRVMGPRQSAVGRPISRQPDVCPQCRHPSAPSDQGRRSPHRPAKTRSRAKPW